jgi:hypothetical protein
MKLSSIDFMHLKWNIELHLLQEILIINKYNFFTSMAALHFFLDLQTFCIFVNNVTEQLFTCYIVNLLDS